MSPLRLPLISYVLRIGLGLSYISLSILSFYAPHMLLDNFPNFIDAQNSLIPIIVGIASVCLTAWILSGKMLLTSSTLSLCIVLGFLIGNVEKPFVIFVLLQTLFINISLMLCLELHIQTPTKSEPVIVPEKILEIVKPIEPEEAVPTIH